MTRSLMDLADMCCRGRLVLCLEGGYDPPALQRSVQAVLAELAGCSVTRPGDLAAEADAGRLRFAILRSSRVHRHRWRGLGAGGA